MTDTTTACLTPPSPAPLAALQVSCANCKLRALCLPAGLDADELARIDGIVEGRRKVRRGGRLFRNGAPFHALYAIRTGVFKTCVATGDGREQVTGFQMAGEIAGLEGIAGNQHTCDAVALEDAQVCVLPLARIEALSRKSGGLQRQVHRILSREIVREHGVMLLLGSMNAEERLAAFLLNLLGRLQARGFSGTALVLRMTREDIGSYLGLTLETVSRTFSKLAAAGLVEVRQRHVRVLDTAALQHIVHQPGRP